jgi:hypothetical protein
MSELNVNRIISQTPTGELIVSPGMVVGIGSYPKFEVTDTGDVKFFGAILLGTQTGNTHGGEMQMVSSSGEGTIKWRNYVYECPIIDNGIPANSILEYIVTGFCAGCTTSTVGEPTAPPGFAFCDGSNQTPDFRSTLNTNTGLIDFEHSCNTPNSFLSGVWTKYLIIRL